LIEGRTPSQIREEIWDRLDSEEKKSFKSVKPDAVHVTNDELNTFNNPEVAEIAENFAVLIVHPAKGKAI
jgi:hypothetical protein